MSAQPTAVTMTEHEQQQIIAVIRSHTEPLTEHLERLYKDLEKVQDGVTELSGRCRAAEEGEDELFSQLLDLMDALDSLDVIRVLEQHTAECRRYQVDALAAQIASIRRRDAYEAARAGAQPVEDRAGERKPGRRRGDNPRTWRAGPRARHRSGASRRRRRSRARSRPWHSCAYGCARRARGPRWQSR